MKTKTLASLEIAIVLCSVFLVALPTIAAASEIYEPGPLDVFGNANEDETIDMRDTTYIKLVIFGKKPKTDFADANYDGKVSMLDVGQTKLIILGKEKKITFIDCFGEAVTVNKPIKRLVDIRLFTVQVTRMLGARDIIVAVGWPTFAEYTKFYPQISKLPCVGGSIVTKSDYEKILSLNPDAVSTGLGPSNGVEAKRLAEEKLPGIPLISLYTWSAKDFSKSLRTYGYILDKEAEAEEVIKWFEGYYSTSKVRTEGLSEDDRPGVYMETGNKPYEAMCSGGGYGQVAVLAGGRNIVEEIEDPDCTWAMDVDPEWVIEQNPEIIIVRARSWVFPCGYETDDISGMKAAREEVLNRPELANVDAVKNGRVFMLDSKMCYGGGKSPIGIAYMGKVSHPDLFKDIDPQAIHQEYVDKFCYVDFDVRKHGVFVYHPELFPNGR